MVKLSIFLMRYLQLLQRLLAIDYIRQISDKRLKVFLILLKIYNEKFLKLNNKEKC